MEKNKNYGGSRSGSGRPKGARNKITLGIKENVEEVFKSLGGVNAMTDWARENPTEFYKLYSKLLPKNIDATVDGTLTINVNR